MITVHRQYVSEFQELSVIEQATLLRYIELTYQPAKTKYSHGSYNVKRYFEWLGFYVTSWTFNDAMIRAGFEPCEVAPQNHTHYYRVKLKRTKISDNPFKKYIQTNSNGRYRQLEWSLEDTEDYLQNYLKLCPNSDREASNLQEHISDFRKRQEDLAEYKAWKASLRRR